MNGKVVDTSKVEIYINKVIDADKVFSKININEKGFIW